MDSERWQIFDLLPKSLIALLSFSLSSPTLSFPLPMSSTFLDSTFSPFLISFLPSFSLLPLLFSPLLVFFPPPSPLFSFYCFLSSLCLISLYPLLLSSLHLLSSHCFFYLLLLWLFPLLTSLWFHPCILKFSPFFVSSPLVPSSPCFFFSLLIFLCPFFSSSPCFLSFSPLLTSPSLLVSSCSLFCLFPGLVSPRFLSLFPLLSSSCFLLFYPLLCFSCFLASPLLNLSLVSCPLFSPLLTSLSLLLSLDSVLSSAFLVPLPLFSSPPLLVSFSLLLSSFYLVSYFYSPLLLILFSFLSFHLPSVPCFLFSPLSSPCFLSFALFCAFSWFLASPQLIAFFPLISFPPLSTSPSLLVSSRSLLSSAFLISFPPFTSPPSPAAHVKKKRLKINLLRRGRRNGGAERKTTPWLLEKCWGWQCHAWLDHKYTSDDDERWNKFIRCHMYLTINEDIFIQTIHVLWYF